MSPVPRPPERTGAGPSTPAPDASVQARQDPQQALNAQTLRPSRVRRQEVAPVLSALALQREVSADLWTRQASLQRQISDVQAALPADALQSALQRQMQQPSPAPLTRVPASPAEWTQAAQREVQRVQDPANPEQTRRLSTADMGAHRRTLQRVTGGLSGGFKADRRPADERHADYGEQLATLQRQPLTRLIPRVFMTQIPAGERPGVQRAVDTALQRLAAQDAQDEQALHLQSLQRQLAAVQAQGQQPVMERILARRGSGTPLPEVVRRHLETGLNHELSAVRIHDDAEADKLAKSMQAIAFTTGTDIFFQSGRFDPNTQTGLELLAHEVTHTVQQSKGQVGKGIDPDAGLESEARAMGQKLAHLPAMPTWVPPAHVGGPHAPGVYTPQAALNRVQQATVGQMALKPLYDLQPGGYARATELSVQRWGLGDAWNATGGKVVSAVADGAEALAAKGKALITSGLSAIPGYKELCLAFGKDLVTGQSVGAQGEGILDTLANWVPGPLKDIMRALKETNVIGKAWAWFQGELGKLNLGGALGEVASAIKSADLGRARAAVTTRISAVKRLILGSANKIAEIALTVITAGLGPVGKKIMAGLRGAGQNIVKILKDPVAFAKNLINAVKGGFSQFASHAPSNLGKVLGGWLGGSTGISFQGGFNLSGLLMTALSVVGLTYQAMRGRLVKALGPGGSEKVNKAETTVAALQTMKSGLQKADEMKSEQGSVGNEIKTGITQEVTQSVLIAGIRKLVVMLVPGGGFINAIIGAFQTVQTIVQQAATIGGVITNALSSVAAIAAGNIGSAVGSIERALVGSLSVALTWLTKVLGLGNLGTRIRGIIAKVKGKLDRVLDKIVAKVKGLIEKLMGKGKEVAGNTADAAKKLINGIFGKQSFQAKKESHSVWVEFKNSDPTFMIASTPAEGRQQLAAFLNDARRVGKAELVTPHVAQGKRIIESGLARIKQKAPTLTDQQARLTQMVGSFTNPLARTVETIRTIVQDEDTGYKFVEVNGIKRMQSVTINFKYNRNSRAEMDRQVAGQQAGLNNIKLDQWTQNRNKYLTLGRDSAGGVQQNVVRARYEANYLNIKLKELDRKNASLPISQKLTVSQIADEAARMTLLEMRRLAALHDPDQIAGGEGMNVTGMGASSVNSSIGSQWKNNVHVLDQAVGKIPNVLRPQGYLNVRIAIS